MKIQRHGYMWRLYGFTRTHIWGVHITSTLLMVAGAGALAAAMHFLWRIPTELFFKLIAISGCAFLGSIAVLLGSILALSFYSGVAMLGLLEGDNEPGLPAGDKGKPASQP